MRQSAKALITHYQFAPKQCDMKAGKEIHAEQNVIIFWLVRKQ